MNGKNEWDDDEVVPGGVSPNPDHAEGKPLFSRSLDDEYIDLAEEIPAESGSSGEITVVAALPSWPITGSHDDGSGEHRPASEVEDVTVEGEFFDGPPPVIPPMPEPRPEPVQVLKPPVPEPRGWGFLSLAGVGILCASLAGLGTYGVVGGAKPTSPRLGETVQWPPSRIPPAGEITKANLDDAFEILERSTDASDFDAAETLFARIKNKFSDDRRLSHARLELDRARVRYVGKPSALMTRPPLVLVLVALQNVPTTEKSARPDPQELIQRAKQHLEDPTLTPEEKALYLRRHVRDYTTLCETLLDNDDGKAAQDNLDLANKALATARDIKITQVTPSGAHKIDIADRQAVAEIRHVSARIVAADAARRRLDEQQDRLNRYDDQVATLLKLPARATSLVDEARLASVVKAVEDAGKEKADLATRLASAENERDSVRTERNVWVTFARQQSTPLNLTLDPATKSNEWITAASASIKKITMPEGTLAQELETVKQQLQKAIDAIKPLTDQNQTLVTENGQLATDKTRNGLVLASWTGFAGTLSGPLGLSGSSNLDPVADPKSWISAASDRIKALPGRVEVLRTEVATLKTEVKTLSDRLAKCNPGSPAPTWTWQMVPVGPCDPCGPGGSSVLRPTFSVANPSVVVSRFELWKEKTAGHWEALFNDGYRSFRTAQYPRAVEQFAAAAEVGDDPRAWYFLALSSLMTGDNVTARDAARYAAARVLLKPDQFKNIGLALMDVQGPARDRLQGIVGDVNQEPIARRIVAVRPNLRGGDPLRAQP